MTTTSPIIAIKDRQNVQQLMDKLPHALLIIAETGLDGAGVAEQLANGQPSDTLHINLPPDKQTISVNQVRDLTAALRTHAIKRRIVIIDPAAKMTEEAQNALLKALEEPNHDVHFLLLAEHADDLLDTIKSRCQILKLHRTSSSQDLKILNRENLSRDSKQQILFLAAGRPLMLQRLARNPSELEKYRQLAADAKIILSQKQSYRALKTIAKYTADRQKSLLLTDIIISMIRFQMYTHGATSKLTNKLDSVTLADQQLQSNGNVRLALLRLVV